MQNNNLKAKSHSSLAVYPWDHLNAMGKRGDGLLHGILYGCATIEGQFNLLRIYHERIEMFHCNDFVFIESVFNDLLYTYILLENIIMCLIVLCSQL